MRINVRLDRSRTAIDTAGQFSHLRVGDAIDIKAIAFVGGNAPSASVRRLNKTHFLKLSHFAANRRAGHTKQLG